MSLLDFDATKYYLGNICRREHNWNDSGFSLRRKNGRECIECAKQDTRTHRDNVKSLVCDFGEKFYLSKICPHSHEWNGTGQSLRYKSNSLCVVCRKEYFQSNKEKMQSKNREYYIKNKKRILEQNKDYASNNRSIRRKSAKKWRDNNKEKVAQSQKKWIQNNRDKKRHWTRKYKIKKKSVQGVSYSSHDLYVLCEKFDNKCAYCCKSLITADKYSKQIDHFLPISTGGRDVLGNLVPSCINCNSSKNNSDPITWFRSKGFPESRLKKILKVLGKTESTAYQIPLL